VVKFHAACPRFHDLIAALLRSSVLRCGLWRAPAHWALGLVFLVAVNTVAQDVQLTQYGHFAWRLQEGNLNGSPNNLAQTPDGYLWIATDSGLMRFHGQLGLRARQVA